MKSQTKKRNVSFSQWGLWLMLLLVGGFHTSLNCLISLVFLGYLFLRKPCGKGEGVSLSLGGVFAGVLTAFYLLSALWGVEGGSALLGFFTFLPLPLYLIITAREQGQKVALETLPYALSVGVVLSLFGMLLPVISDYFTVAGRLAGFLQYPNTFGILLLAGQLLLLTKEGWKKIDFAVLALLILGIFLTGSRTVFVLFLVGNFGAIFFVKNKKIRWSVLACLPVALGVAVLICAVTGNMDVIARYLSLSFLESTFVGRLLYAYDALPVVFSHPLGLGYLGYAYLQPSFQTGMYTVLYAHNDFLQILLDVGFVPFLFLLFVVGKTVFSGDVPGTHKWIFLVMTAHALLDFDFQYLSVFALYLLFTPALKKPVKIRRPLWGRVLAGALVPVCLYFGTGLLIGGKTATKMLPFSTKLATAAVGETPTLEEKRQVGEALISHNPRYYLGYQILGNLYFSEGDFGKMMEHTASALELAPFDTKQYTDTAYQLAYGVNAYRRVGDKNSANFCLAQLKALPRYITKAQEKISGLGKRIADQPNFEEAEAYILQLIDSLE